MKVILLVGTLTVATVGVLAVAPAWLLDPYHACESGFSTLIDCNYHWSSTTTFQSTPIFPAPASSTGTTPPGSAATLQPGDVDVTSWAVAHCPRNYIARRLLCATPPVAATVQPANGDRATGLPLPKPWLVTTARNSPVIEAVHVETPRDLAAVLGFYRVELGKRGWTENGGAVVEPNAAEITFKTPDGPALLRLIHQDDITIVDLSLRKPAATRAGNLPKLGRVRLMLGNATDEAAVITINEQTITLPANDGGNLADKSEFASKSPDRPGIDLAPGNYQVTLKVASGAAQNTAFKVAADETWALLVGPAGVALPVHIY